MAYETIAYSVEEDELRATITIDRPDRMNALSSRTLDEISSALADAEANERVRAVVVTGRGEAFSAGFDLVEDTEAATTGGEDNAAPTGDELLDSVENITDVFYDIWQLNTPVVAAVNGHCLAGGSDLALVCDVLVASEEATFGYPGQRLSGHPPLMTYPFFMGIHQAKELLLTGKVIDAERAERMGIFNRVVPAGDALSEAYAEVDEIKKVPGNGVRICKHSINSVAERQGLRTAFKMSEFLDPLAQMMELSVERHETINSDDEKGMDALLEWMHEKDKTMRDVVE